MVSADESRPETGSGSINGKVKPSRSKASGKTTEQRQRKASQGKDSQSKEIQAKESQSQQAQKSESAPDALPAATESMPEATEPKQQPVAAADTPDAAADIVPEPVSTAPLSLSAITDAYGDYTRKSIEQTSSFFQQLAGSRSLDKAFELQSQFARSAFETFVDESRKIRELHRELAKQKLQSLEGFMMGSRARR